MATVTLSRQQAEMLPHYRRKTAKEWSAACPVCGGKDRLCIWPESGNFWCRRCGLKGFFSDNERGGWDRERYLAEVAKQQERERAARQAALDIIATKTERAALYHHQMTDRSYWYQQGLTDATIDAYQLGWTPRCPTFPQSPSWTIPVTYRNRLFNIRHRLAKPPTPGDKYRPEMAGLGNAVFNADLADQGHPVLLCVEGEIKSMALTQRGYPAIGVPGASSFQPRWARFFANAVEVFVVFDPGAEAQAYRVARMIGPKARVVTLPVKPDDFFVLYNGRKDDFDAYLAVARQPKPDVF